MLIKKLFILILLISFFRFPVDSLQEDQISAGAAVVVESETNNVIFQKNMSEKLSMASTTKIMTSILAIESGKLNCTVTAKNDVVCDGTSIGIKKGDSFTLETLVWAMLLESGNDASVLVAEYLAGSEEGFSDLMNDKASEIGMNNTNFVTASGLDDDEHYTTAYDMALLASYAIKNPVFRKICSSERYVASYVSPNISETYVNHNKLLKMYDGVFGVKTGFTKKSGRCLVSACERNGTTLVAVTLKAPDDWNDHVKLYDYCFGLSKKIHVNVELPCKIKVYGSDVERINISMCDVSELFLYSDSVYYTILLPEFVYAPVKVRDEVGKVILFVDGEKYKEISVTASEEALSVEGKEEPEYTFFYKLTNIFRFMKG